MWIARKWTVLSLLLCVAIAGLVIASEEEGEEKAYKVGDTVKPITLKDADGKEHDLGKYLGKKIIVLDFWNLGCPVSRAYEERLMNLTKKYGIKNYGKKEEESTGSGSTRTESAGSSSAKSEDEAEVVFFAIDSNKTNDLDAIKEYAKEHNLPYPVLKDWENKIADKFDARVTPEIFVIGKDKKIKYHGPIDDSQNPEKIENQYLRDALDALLNDKEVEAKEKRAFGCTIKRV